MKCPCCNGTGRTQMVTIVKTDSGLPCDFPCIECDGTGEVEMTNEYFLRTATRKQLAEWITKCIKDTIILTHGNRKYTDNIVSAKWWEEWLKQPHNKGVTKNAE